MSARPEGDGPSLASLGEVLGPEVEDATEETFLLFAQDIPSQNLGFVDPKATALDVEVHNHTFMISQSPGLLRSDRETGTTGAVVWKITPLVASWLSSTENFLWNLGWLSHKSNIVELGCGVSGLIALSMLPVMNAGIYLLTDQTYVMKLLRDNLDGNQTQRNRKIRSGYGLKIETLPFDWETDAASNVMDAMGTDGGIDLIVACDCIYNEYLIPHLIESFASFCDLSCRRTRRRTGVLIAQQLRSEEVLDAWLEEMLKLFAVFRVPQSLLPTTLHAGYALHIAVLRY